MNKAIVLAAGEGTRMKSKKPKVMHEVLGKTMISHVVEELSKCELEEIIVIVGRQKDLIIEGLKDYDNITFREQKIGKDYPYGTGYAVMQAIDRIGDEDRVLVVNGDTPIIKGETLVSFLKSIIKSDSHAGVLTAIVEDSYGYGRILRNEDGFISEIVEEDDANEAEKKIKEINSGVYAFNGKDLKENLSFIDTNNAQKELYLTDVITILSKKAKKIIPHLAEDSSQIQGVNSRVQLAECEKILKDRINSYWMDEGVSLISPENTYIQKGVTLGKDVVLGPGVRLEGNSTIGDDCVIMGQSRIVDSTIKEGTWIESSHVVKSTVGRSCKIGPFSHVRPNCSIGDNVSIGNFAELKNTSFGDDSKMGHHSYVGDAQVGKGVNIGAGVITVNYDGKDKHTTILKDGSFIGSNSNLIAPVLVEEGGYIAAGSTITKDVGQSELAIARSRQSIIKNWSKE